MEFLDKSKKKKKNIEDVLLVEKKDRRILSHVPDKTKERGDAERRGYESSHIHSYEDYIAEKTSGIRYITGFDVELKTFDKKDPRKKVTCKAVDISNTGMLLELSEADYNALINVERLKTHFRVTPGSMPEGYEMRVSQKIKVVRRVVTEDGRHLLGITFTKHLHNYAAAGQIHVYRSCYTAGIFRCMYPDDEGGEHHILQIQQDALPVQYNHSGIPS